MSTNSGRRRPTAGQRFAGIGDRVVVEARDDEVVVRRSFGVLEFVPPRPRSKEPPWKETRQAAREGRSGSDAE